MRRLLAIAGVLVVAGLIGLVAIILWPIGHDEPEIALEGNVRDGAYLARAAGCISCHSREGGEVLGGGAPLVTDFGTFHPPNISPDPEAGIGGWSVAQFAKAVRQGISPGGHPYYPAFPSAFYAAFTDQQIADLHAALGSVPAVAESAPPHEVGFPFDQRWGLKLWRAAFEHAPDVAPVEGRSEAWNRGKELAEGASHCAACHTDRNFVGGLIESRHFAGSDDLPGGERAPAILPAALAEEGWDVDAITDALASGMMPDGDTFGGAMAEVVAGGTTFLTEEDRRAIATYLMEGR